MYFLKYVVKPFHPGKIIFWNSLKKHSNTTCVFIVMYEHLKLSFFLQGFKAMWLLQGEFKKSHTKRSQTEFSCCLLLILQLWRSLEKATSLRASSALKLQIWHCLSWRQSSLLESGGLKQPCRHVAQPVVQRPKTHESACRDRTEADARWRGEQGDGGARCAVGRRGEGEGRRLIGNWGWHRLQVSGKCLD